jgi:flagellar biosynthesis protein FlhG
MKDQAEKLREVIDDLKRRQEADRQMMPKPLLKRSARVITVTSGKGGVGKTNITINLSIALSERGFRVVILDADFGLANIDVLFGIIPKYTIVDVMQNRKNIFEILTDGPKNIKFISGGSGMEELVKLDKEQILKFVDNMSLLDKLADVIIVDTGAGLSESVISFIMAADEVLLVTTPEPTSITDAYALMKMVSNRDKSKKIRVVVNRAENAGEARNVMDKLKLVAEKFLGIEIEATGYVLQDDMVVKAVKHQEPFITGFPRSPAARNIKEISQKLVESGENTGFRESSGIKVFLNKLVGFIKV